MAEPEPRPQRPVIRPARHYQDHAPALPPAALTHLAAHGYAVVPDALGAADADAARSELEDPVAREELDFRAAAQDARIRSDTVAWTHEGALRDGGQ